MKRYARRVNIMFCLVFWVVWCGVVMVAGVVVVVRVMGWDAGMLPAAVRWFGSARRDAWLIARVSTPRVVVCLAAAARPKDSWMKVCSAF
jgi:hypothetical protein